MGKKNGYLRLNPIFIEINGKAHVDFNGAESGS